MSALELAGLLPQLGELTPRGAGRWVAASLAQAAALREHDGSLYPTDPARLPRAERLHAAWRQWADDAEALLRRVEAMHATAAVAGLDDLRDAVGRAQAMLQLTPAAAAERRARAAGGDVFPPAEVRRELQLHDRG